MTTDCMYVVKPLNYCPLSDEPQSCFEFKHPNCEKLTNQRKSRLCFDIEPSPSELMGFVGYFDVNLYRDIVLSTHPKRHTIGLNSWFPALFPLRNLIRIGKQQTTVILDISRKVDVTGVWYEWFVEVQDKDGTKFVTELQNNDGRSQYMRL